MQGSGFRGFRGLPPWFLSTYVGLRKSGVLKRLKFVFFFLGGGVRV